MDSSSSGSNGVVDSTPGTDAVFTGSMPVCSLEVTSPGSAATTSCAFTAPVAGLLRYTMANPDGSRDGTFVIDLGTYGNTWLFTGLRDWAYGGDTVLGLVSRDAEQNVTPAMGPLSVAIEYDPAAGDENTGTDTLFVDFVYYDQLSTAGATLVGSHAVNSGQSADANYGPTIVNDTVASGERLLIESVQCGSAGFGAHSLYLDSDGNTGNDGFTRTLNGVADECTAPLRSLSVDPGAYLFSIAHEDDFFTDNSGSRELAVYRYTP